MKIHKEGYLSIVIILTFVVLLNLTVYYSLLFWFVTIPLIIISAVFFFFIVRFFRHPIRKIKNTDEKVIYAPADGKVVVIEEIEESEYFKEKRLQVSIFMSPLDIHVNWTTTVIKTSNNVEILIRQIAGAVARRIVYYAKVGKKFGQGDELGFIKFGSRVDLFFIIRFGITNLIKFRSLCFYKHTCSHIHIISSYTSQILFCTENTL